MKILRPFTGTGAVFFPLGQPPEGTCEYATKKCENECYANGRKNPNFDEELRISEKEKKRIYKYFMTTSIRDICYEIFVELDGLQTPILHWFGSGDCLIKDIERISAIIKGVDKSIVQMGFTRNKELWNRHKDIFALTIESEKEATDDEGIYAIPNYENQTSIMYSPKYQIKGGYCGPLTCQDLLLSELLIVNPV